MTTSAAAKDSLIKEETALQLLLRLEDPTLCLSTGYKQFDALLGGQIKLKAVTEIAGDTGAGKYMLAMTIMAEVLLSEDKKNKWVVHVLTYNQSISRQRLIQVIQERTGNKISSDAIRQLLARVVFERIFSAEDLDRSLKQLTNEYSGTNLIPLVVINNVAALLSEQVHDATAEGEIGDTSAELDASTVNMLQREKAEASAVQEDMLKTMRVFLQFTGGTIVCISDVVHWRVTGPSAALGGHWINNIPSRLLLCRHPSDSSNALTTFYAQAVCPNTMLNGKRVNYSLTENGFEFQEIEGGVESIHAGAESQAAKSSPDESQIIQALSIKSQSDEN